MNKIIILGGVGLLGYWYYKNAKQIIPSSASDVTNAIAAGAKTTEQQLIDYAKSNGNSVVQLQNQNIVAQPQPSNLPGQPVVNASLPDVSAPTKQSISQPVLSPALRNLFEGTVTSQYIQPEGAPVKTILEPKIVTAAVSSAIANNRVARSPMIMAMDGLRGNFRD